MDESDSIEFSLREQIDICSKQYALFEECLEAIEPKLSEADQRLCKRLAAISDILLSEIQNNSNYWDG